MSNWFSNLFSSKNVATAASMAGTVDPQASPLINTISTIGQQVLGNGQVAQGLPVQVLPVAPSGVQLQAALQAVQTAQANYQALLAQVKAVEAYNAIMQQVTDAQVVGKS